MNSDTNRPPVEIFPPGKSPIYKSPLQKFMKFGGFTVSILLSASMSFLVGGDYRERHAILLNQQYTVTYLYHDPIERADYAVINNSSIVALNFEDRKVSPILSAPSVDSIIVGNNRLFYCSELNSEVVAIDTATKEKAWTLSKIWGARALTMYGGSIAFLAGGEHRMLVVDPASGAIQKSIQLPGIPFDLISYRGRYYISIYDSNTVLAVDPESGRIVERYRTDPGPDQLGANARGVWVASRLSHTLRLLIKGTGESPSFALVNQDTTLASSGTKMAIGGIERITTVDANGNLDRIPFADEMASAIAIGEDDDVLFAEEGRIFLINSR
jgi:hypothetical protein